MKIFKESTEQNEIAYFGWQSMTEYYYGLREGYKNAADDLIELISGGEEDIVKLDTYIFPIIFSYRHSIEIVLKHIYYRAYGKRPEGGHDLLMLWDNVQRDVVERIIETKLNDFRLNKNTIRSMIKELQEANQIDGEVNPSNKQVDQKAEVWRYLIDKEDIPFFKKGHFVEYGQLKKAINYLYDELDWIYDIIDESLPC